MTTAHALEMQNRRARRNNALEVRSGGCIKSDRERRFERIARSKKKAQEGST
jgi:hypothetical protein